MAKLSFPKGFLWGSAGSAYQTEGGNEKADWWRWEHSARRMADLAAHGKKPEDYFSGAACDSYHRYAEDFGIAAELNMNTQRVSIEWSRIQPTPDTFDRAALDHYREVLGAIRSRGMTVFLTLHHFTVPQWFADMGGFEKRENLAYFERYAAEAISSLGDLVDFLTPINEPNVFVTFGYLQGAFPPQKRNPLLALRVLDNFVYLHRSTYEMVKARVPRIQVGTAYSFTADRFVGLAAIAAPYLLSVNHRFIDRVADRSDFVGIQYYFSHAVKLTPKIPFVYSTYERGPFTDFGWEVYPKGIYDIVQFCARRYPSMPIYITENGIADASDSVRAAYIRDHLAWLHRAIAEGADVRGYIYWSLLDNFEWAEGYRMKFGLVAVDFEHGCARRVRESARCYAQICKENGLDIDEAPPGLEVRP